MSRRVAQEQGEPLGKSVGYQIRLEKVMPSTPDSVLFCTTGVLLRRMQGDTQLEDFTHVVLDEVHERDVKSDFLMMLLRDLIRIRSDIRIILMSATLNARLFSDYFGGTPMLHVCLFLIFSFSLFSDAHNYNHRSLDLPILSNKFILNKSLVPLVLECNGGHSPLLQERGGLGR